jgi:hypothetical protein
MLLVELATGLSEYAVRPLPPKTCSPLVKASHAAWVITFLHWEGAGLVLMESALGGLVEVAEVTQGTFQPPPIVTVLILWEGLDDFADETSQVVGPQALGGIGPMVWTEAHPVSGEDLVDVTGIRGVRPTELLSNAAVRLQDPVSIEDIGGGSYVLTDGNLMWAPSLPVLLDTE